MTEFNPLKFGLPQFAPTEVNSVNEQCGDEAKMFRQTAEVMREVAERLGAEGETRQAARTRAKAARLARYSALYFEKAAGRTIGHKKADMWFEMGQEMIRFAKSQEAIAIQELESLKD